MSSTEKTHRGSPYARELISFLQPYCTTRNVAPGEQLDLQVNGQSVCYLILEGTVAIYRRSDNMMLTTARSPALFGLANLTDIYFNDYLKTVTPCLTGMLTTVQVEAVIKENGLWGLLSKEGANKQVISSQADSLIKISRIWADFFPANTSNQPI